MGSFPETYNDPGILGGGVPPGSPISDQKMSFCTPVFRPGARFSKAPVINGPVKLLLFTCKIEVSVGFISNMIKLSVSKIKWSSLLARTRALILYITI